MYETAIEKGLWSLLGLAFALGLSHGADPDHLAAIDGMTRASVERHPGPSRWVGTLFAFGHSLTVLLIAALIALAVEPLMGLYGSASRLGGLASAMLLFAIGTINLLLLRRAQVPADRHGTAGLLSRHLRPRVFDIAHPLAAIPVGALFGLGFETASQMAAWALAGTLGYGLSGGLLIGVAFSTGMMVTDSVNGLLVRRLYLSATRGVMQNGRGLTLTVILLAYGIGILKLLQQTPYAPPVSDLSLTILVLASVLLSFTVAVMRARSPLPS